MQTVQKLCGRGLDLRKKAWVPGPAVSSAAEYAKLYPLPEIFLPAGGGHPLPSEALSSC